MAVRGEATTVAEETAGAEAQPTTTETEEVTVAMAQAPEIRQELGREPLLESSGNLMVRFIPAVELAPSQIMSAMQVAQAVVATLNRTAQPTRAVVREAPMKTVTMGVLVSL